MVGASAGRSPTLAISMSAWIAPGRDHDQVRRHPHRRGAPVLVLGAYRHCPHGRTGRYRFAATAGDGDRLCTQHRHQPLRVARQHHTGGTCPTAQCAGSPWTWRRRSACVGQARFPQLPLATSGTSACVCSRATGSATTTNALLPRAAASFASKPTSSSRGHDHPKPQRERLRRLGQRVRIRRADFDALIAASVIGDPRPAPPSIWDGEIPQARAPEEGG